MNDDRRLANNPFVRALGHEAGERGIIGRAAVGVLSLGLALVFAASLIVPALASYGMIVRGVQRGSLLWGGGGSLLALLYVAALFFTLRKPH